MARKKYGKEPNEKQKQESVDVKNWFDRIHASEMYRKRIGQKYRWEQLIEEYRGYFVDIQSVADIYIPSLNLIFAYVKSEIPSLYLRDPKIKVNPKKGSSLLSAKILEKALNYIWRTKRLKRENKKNIFDDLLVGHSWFKTGYTGKFGTIETGDGDFEFIEDEDFFGYRVPFENITFNPDAQDPPYDCRWIAHEVWMSKEEAENNKSFDQNVVQEVNFQVLRDQDKLTKNIADSDPNLRQDPVTKKGKFYEVWDKTTGTKFVLADGIDRYVCAPKEWPYDMRGFPFSFLRLNDDPLNPYGIPDCYMFETLVLELMKLQASVLDHVKRFNRQLLLAEGTMSDDTIEQFKQGVTGAVLPVQTGSKSLGDVAMPIPYPPVQADIYAIENRIKEYIVRISGQTAIDQGGQQDTKTRSLGELDRIQEGGRNRRSDKIDTIEDFVEDIAGNLVALLQQLADLPYFVRIYGDDLEKEIAGLEERPSATTPGAVTGKDGFTFTKEDIKGEFDFEVVAGSTTPLNQAQKLELLQFLLSNLQNFGVMPGGPVTQYLGTELADEIDLAGFKIAVKQEIEQAQEANKQRAEQEKAMAEMEVARESADLSIKAEREANKQAKTELEGVRLMHELRNPPKQEKKPNG